MNVILKPAGLMVIVGALSILATGLVVKSQRSDLPELPAIDTPIAGLQSSKRATNGAVSVFDGKDAMEMVDLSDTGKLDWVHWGQGGPHRVNRKQTGGTGGAISDYTLVSGAAGLLNTGEHGPSRGFTWSGGTPTAALPVTYAGAHLGAKNGFQFTVRTDAAPHTLRVYVGGYKAGGEFSAWLPDGSAPVKVAVKETALQSGYYSRVYTVSFRPAAPGQPLKVVWRAVSLGGGGNLSLQAATLQ